jgi:hypothetical protein
MLQLEETASSDKRALRYAYWLGYRRGVDWRPGLLGLVVAGFSGALVGFALGRLV